MIAIGVGLSLLVGVFSALVALRDWNIAVEIWRARTAGASQLIAAHARQVLGGAEIILHGLQRDLVALDLEDEDAFRREVRSQRWFETLRDRMAGAPQVDVASITDASGEILVYSREFPPPPINLSDRDYFRKKILERSGERFVSIPVRNRGTGEWTFYMAEPILAKSGRLLGMALVGIRSEFFNQFYRDSFFKVDREIALVRNDGVVLAREPQRVDPGHSLAEATFVRSPESVAAGIWTDQAAAEPGLSKPRFIAAARVADFPVIVGVAAFSESVLTGWYKMTTILVLAALALSSLLIGFSFWASAMLERRQSLLIAVGEARDAAERADSAKTGFLSMVSHELRTPLNSLVGGVELLRRMPDAGRMQKYVDVIDVSARQLLGLIEGLLNFMKSDFAQSTGPMRAFSLHEVLKSCVMIARGMAANRRGAISLQIEESVPAEMVGDSVSLMQIVLNLLSNSIKYAPAGDIRVHASLEPSADDKAYLRIVVSDDGPGIPDDMQRRLFRPWQRGEDEDALRQQGSGLGLAIVARLVQRLEGSIAVRNSDSGGAVFSVAVPFERPGEDISRGAEQTRGGLKVLVADDTAASRFVLRAMLEKLGHEVTVATGGLEAVEAAASTSFDAVMLDIEMPDLDGYEACRRIRAIPGRSRILIVAMTAHDSGEHKRRMQQAGMDKHMVKPITLADLEHVLGDAVIEQGALDAV